MRFQMFGLFSEIEWCWNDAIMFVYVCVSVCHKSKHSVNEPSVSYSMKATVWSSWRDGVSYVSCGLWGTFSFIVWLTMCLLLLWCCSSRSSVVVVV